jgi:arylsulfatase A
MRTVLSLLGFGILCLGAHAAAIKPPNIVILYADDMGYGDLAIQNPESKIPTPHLDRLAREGIRFTDAHSSSGICTPSRYALLTGRFHWRKFHEIVTSFDPPVLDPAEVTLPEVLKAAGYRTACVGKWHLGWNWNDILKPGAKPAMDARGRNKIYPPEAFDWSRPISGGPRSHGFDYYFGDDVPNFPPYAWFENDRVITHPSQPLNITPETAEGSWEARPGPMTPGWDFYAVIPHITGKAVEWIAGQRGAREPFFLYVPFNSPHAPIVPAPEYRGKSQAGGYGDFMHQTDAEAGRILRALEENGFAENTLVIFTADNGAERYAYERVRNFQHRSSGALRGLKRDLYEGGHRMPFIVKWPGVIKPGTVSDALVSQVDLMATLAAVAGAEVPANAAHDSYNLLPAWKSGAASPRRTLVHNTFADAYAVRHENWLLIATRTGTHTAVPAWFAQENGYTRNDQPGELYDLSRDLGQNNNLYSKRPDKVAELSELLAKIRARGQVR